jgi:hypothetical protein
MLDTEQKIHRAALLFLAGMECEDIKDITYPEVAIMTEDSKNLLLLVWLHKYGNNKLQMLSKSEPNISLSSRLLVACLDKIKSEGSYA